MSVTLNDIAKKAGVSVSTASRILNNKSEKCRISEKTQLLVETAAQELKYRPNQLARGLRLKKTNTIGLILPDISNPFFAYVARMIQKNAFQAGYSLIVCNTDENLETEMTYVELLRRKRLDGYIIMPVGTKYDHLKQMLEDKLSLVLLDRSFDELNANSVVVDNYQGAFEAVEHLILSGHTRIAIIQGTQETFTNTQRVKGYRDALAKYNIDVKEKFIVGKDFRIETGYIETKFLMHLENPPTAIFTTSDVITLGCLQAIFEENLKIPDNISLIAFDDIDFAPYLVAPLTAVRQPKELMGEMAVKLLIEDLEYKTKQDKKRIVLKPNLMIRSSVLKLPRSSTTIFQSAL